MDDTQQISLSEAPKVAMKVLGQCPEAVVKWLKVSKLKLSQKKMEGMVLEKVDCPAGIHLADLHEVK